MRVLYMHATCVPPPEGSPIDRFELLSENLEGDILHPLWFTKPEEVEAAFGPGSYPVHTVGRFRYHWILEGKERGIRSRMTAAYHYLRKGVQIHREKPFDCIVVYSHMTIALYAVILKLITGAKLITEVATVPNLVFRVQRPHPSLKDRLMQFYSDICLHVTLWMSNRAHLLYPGQLAYYRWLKDVPSSVFHEFVAVSAIPRHTNRSEKYVLLVGAPWYLKGTDLLIEAFLRMAAEFPDVKLRIMGWYPRTEELQGRTAGSPQIELMKAAPNPVALKAICGATVLVLPSRCEGMGRVILEAMAAGVPVIGSSVGGIPHLIRDGETGFIVPANDAASLERKLRQLLSDESLRERMGETAWQTARSVFNEKTYVDAFTDMVSMTLGRLRGGAG